MGGPPARDEREPSAALASSLQLALPARRALEHERPGGASREPYQRVAGVETANLFVRVDEDDRCHSGDEAVRDECPESEDDLDQTPLHVEDARPEDLPVLAAEGHRVGRAQRPDGVEMSDEQLVPRPPEPLSWTRVEVVSEVTAGNATDEESESLELARENRPRSPERRRIERRRLGEDELFEQSCHLVRPAPQPGEQRLGGAPVHSTVRSTGKGNATLVRTVVKRPGCR